MSKIEWVEIGPCRLALGDCLEVLPTLDDDSVDAVVTDPPYSSSGAFRGDRTAKAITKYVQSENQHKYTDFGGDSRDQRGFFAWSSLWMTAAWNVTAPGGVLVCFSDWRQLPVMTDCVQLGGWCWRNLGTWWKPGIRMQRGRFSSSAEYVVYATKGAHASDGDKSPQNVFSFPSLQSDDKEHIAEKPVEVVKWCLGLAKAESTILDPFMGSGTTGHACIKTRRRFIGIEKDPVSFAIACERIRKAWAEENAPLYRESEAS